LGADYGLGNQNCPPDIHGVLEVSVGDGAGGLREGHGDGIPVDPSPSAVVVVGRGFDRGQGEDVLDVPLSSRPDQGCAAVAALVTMERKAWFRKIHLDWFRESGEGGGRKGLFQSVEDGRSYGLLRRSFRRGTGAR